MPLTRTILCWKQHIDRYGMGAQGTGLGELHLPVGRFPDGWAYRVFLQFSNGNTYAPGNAYPTVDWGGVGQIVSAKMHLATAGPGTGHGAVGPSPSHEVRYVNYGGTYYELDASLGENYWYGEGVGGPGTHAYRDQLVTRSNSPVIPMLSPTGAGGQHIEVDITDLYEEWAPPTVLKRNGQPCIGRTNNGLHIMSTSEGYPSNQNNTVFWSRSASNLAANRPYVTLTYEPPNAPPTTPTLTAPVGNVPRSNFFTGTFTDPNPGDQLKATHIRLYEGATLIWDQTYVASSGEVGASAFSVPIPGLVKSGVNYEWDAQTQDQRGVWSSYSPHALFRFLNTKPSLSALNPDGTSFASLSLVQFQASYSDSESDPMGSYRIQLRVQTAPGHADWSTQTHKWDTGNVTPTSTEVGSAHPSASYSGSALTPGIYSWRIAATDQWGEWSDWQYATITITAPWNPDPGAIDYLTGYGHKPPRPRIVIRGMNATTRGPVDPPLAIIEDAANIGASQYHNAEGEVYFTLPATHPQIGEIEPYKVHYAVEIWRNDRFVEIFAGVITDFDATADDAVIYGTDYLGMLNKIVDSRYDPVNGIDHPYTGGGSKYPDIEITTVISDQLTMAKNKSNSPVNFINTTTMDVFAEKVTIWSTFTPVLSFIAGLMDSHVQDTGKRSRLWVRKTAAGGYEFLLKDNPGVVRDNIRLEYGGLVQGFRLTAFGEFATYSHGIGKAHEGVNLHYTSETAPGIDPTAYGRIENVRVWDEVNDKADLQRRLKNAAARAARVGKRVAMALRVDVLQPFDGWDITDHLPVHIKRGIVDTEAYGSGYWTIVGVEWFVFPDGHTDLTLVVLPREDNVPPDPDLIPSNPIFPTTPGGAGTGEWEIGYIPPTEAANSSKLYLDLTTGITYEQQTDGSYLPLDVPPTPGPPSAFAMASSLIYDATGDAVPSLDLTVAQAPGTNIRGAWVEVTATDNGAGAPVWDETAAKVFIPVDADPTTSIPGVAGDTTFFGRAWSEDFVGVASAMTAVESVVTVMDDVAPPVPTAFAVTGSLQAVLASWEPSPVSDLAFYEARYAIDDGTGTGPGSSPAWTVIRARTSFLVIGGLADVTRYWVQVRAIDRSGNVLSGSTAVNYLDNPGVGYATALSAVTTQVDAELIEPGAITPVHIEYLDAGDIKTGTLKINTTTTGMSDGIIVYADDGVTEIGRWDEDGLYIFSSTDPGIPTGDYIRITEAGLTIYIDGQPTTIIDESGLNANAIAGGSLPGNMNLVVNSSFEMGAVTGTTRPVDSWNVAADWNTSRVGTDTNVTTNAGDLQQTAGTY